MPDPARLVMCDDHAMFLDMLAEYLNNQSDLEVVHTQNNSDDLLSVLEQHNPDLLLSDLVLPGPDIYETFAKIFRRRPETRILVMSGMFNASNTTRLHNLGVHGIVSKMGTVNDILSVIRMVLAGKVHYPEAFMEKLRTDPDSVVPKISKREGEIMALIAAGL